MLTLPSGHRVSVYPGRMTYRGEVVLQWPDGRTYRGGWADGAPEGRGEQTLPDGTCYRGQWHQGRHNGTGELLEASGRRYVGEFVDGKRQGTGTLTGPDGVYRGHWSADPPDGVGVFEGADGGRYRGDWQRGLRAGYGRYRSPDGTRYQGDWAFDEPHGFGRFSAPDGAAYQGAVRHGTRDGYGRAEGPPGLVYEGTWVDGRRQGFGREQRPDGSSYLGDWQGGHRQGQGLEIRADGSYHDGRWELDHILGPGQRHARSGIDISGLWNGDRVSSGLLDLPTGLKYAGPLFRGADGRASRGLLEWLNAAAQNGDPYAALLLGSIYLDTVPVQVDRARPWLQAAARAGIADAQYRLALTYEHVDAPRVVELLAEAARQDHAEANQTLGEYYYGGITVPRNLQRAIGYFQRAVDGGSVTARNDLAWLLATADQPELRDGRRAVALIRPIALVSGRWQYLDTLAAAWAAAGNFDAAVAAAGRAIEAARHDAGGATWGRAGLERRLALYRAGRAYIQPAPRPPLRQENQMETSP